MALIRWTHLYTPEFWCQILILIQPQTDIATHVGWRVFVIKEDSSGADPGN